MMMKHEEIQIKNETGKKTKKERKILIKMSLINVFNDKFRMISFGKCK